MAEKLWKTCNGVFKPPYPSTTSATSPEPKKGYWSKKSGISRKFRGFKNVQVPVVLNLPESCSNLSLSATNVFQHLA